jgi:hypothetical protein
MCRHPTAESKLLYFFASSAAFSPSFLAFSHCFARTSLISACVARGCQYSRTEGKGRT